MSKFWGRDSSDEEEEETTEEESSGEEESSDDDDDSSSEDESGSGSSDSDSDSDDEGPNKFLAGSSDSDSDDDRRVVKSEKDKRMGDLAQTAEDIRNKIKINDWSTIQELFDILNQRLERTRKFLVGPTVPRVYLKCLIELEDYLNETLGNKDLKKKMSQTNAKAFNTMRQRLKKHNINFADQMTKVRENPDEDDEEEDAESASSESESGDERDQEDRKHQQQQKAKDKLLTMDPKEITYEVVARKLREIVVSRGRRSTDKQEQVEMLTYLVTVARGSAQRFEVLAQLTSSLFDLNPGMMGHLQTGLWKKCVVNLFEMLRILQDNPNIKVEEGADSLEERTEQPPDGAEVRVWGNVVAFVERLDDELFKSLQVIDPHTHEYMARLRDEPVYLALGSKVLEYLQRVGDTTGSAKVALRLVEHLYYKTAAVYDAMRKLTLAQQHSAATPPVPVDEGEEEEPGAKVEVLVPSDYVMAEDCHELMHALVGGIIFKYGDERTKARAMMCYIYHKAIHDDFYGARDLLLMSHLQDSIQHMDVSTMILYNRAMAQLGLAAFRAGLIQEAHACLNELYGSGHIKELLAQGMSMGKYHEKTPEQELAEKRRQMPFHMHITLELLESAYLTCAMLLEVPNMAANPLNAKKKMISKSFHRIWDTYARQAFTGPPENVRDHIMAASRALAQGDWSKSFNYLKSLNAWNLLPKKDQVLGMLKVKVQEEAVRTYLLTYSSQYASLSLDQLASMFELPDKQIYSIASKMMIAEELLGAWDQPTRTIVMHASESSRVQRMALQLADKALAIVELNGLAFSYRSGGLRDADDEGGAGPGASRRRGGQWDDEGGAGGRSRGGTKLTLVRNLGGRGDRGDRSSVRSGPRSGGMGGRGGGGYRRDGGMGGGSYGDRVGGGPRGYGRPGMGSNLSSMSALGSLRGGSGGMGMGPRGDLRDSQRP
ncbi:hypothetical protein Vretimale_18799 [Volvox reticuliferus]|uniref:Eukaryotic translation initiation factor 3 subunit C n=1 Tax=Volvox reticuliferus TaxID=1737510 RepID=A0A8J4GY31_9CHLO|nr:hypothetical protein Vretifemale_18870 [Volvox reticuliferus]GIM16147.1 hypothetical protein Vretimale_18799 [Volvox reticuliferus]